jgi:heat shock protein HslJ
MKNVLMILAFVVFTLPAILFPACAAVAPAQEGGSTFKDVEGKEWMLSEVKGAEKNVTIDRKKLELENMLGFFTVNFQEGQTSGTGAPNRFTGPYTAGDNRSLSFGNLAGTKMMALREPDGINENEYFACLSGVTRWDLRDGKLELYSAADGGTTLIFALK